MTGTARIRPTRAQVLDLAASNAYQAMKAHYANCTLCNPQFECVQGIRERGSWQALDQALAEIPAAFTR